MLNSSSFKISEEINHSVPVVYRTVSERFTVAANIWWFDYYEILQYMKGSSQNNSVRIRKKYLINRRRYFTNSEGTSIMK